MTELHISCAAVGPYVPHSAALLHSALTSTRDCELVIHYLHGPGLEARDRARLEAMVTRMGGAIRFHAIDDEQVSDLPCDPLYTPAMWYRTFLPELALDADRVLYLDVDTLVLDDLDPLRRIDLTGQHLAAVTNVFMPYHHDRPASLGLVGPRAYFNSGVLLLHLDELRRDRAMEAVRDYARSHREILWPDQDALNVVLGERRLALEPRWNCMNSLLAYDYAEQVFDPAELERARRDPAIRHFEGPGINKPWHYLYPLDRGELYREHRRGTPWPRVRQTGLTPANVLRRLTRRPSPFTPP